MKKLNIIFFSALFTIVFSSCSTEPTACFTVDKSTAQVNSPIVCDASCSVDAEDYMWFNDHEGASVSGNASSVTETYTFSMAGTYEIELHVTNGKETSIATQTVTITE